MIITKIHAGLGNQLFQYAFGRALSLKLDLPLKIEISPVAKEVFRLDKYKIDLIEATDSEIKLLKRKEIRGLLGGLKTRLTGRGLYLNNRYHVEEYTYDNDKEKLSNAFHIYLSGYWFDQKYFIEAEKTILNDFVLKESLDRKNSMLKEEIRKKNSVFLHIRRKDYLTNSFLYNLGLSYYYRAVDYVSQQISDPVFFIFSDDIEWCKSNLRLNFEHHFVDINDSSTDFMELELMSTCQHSIIANSTFSWWGAWLNKNKTKLIIAPKIWWNDKSSQLDYEQGRFVPANWIKIGS
jgi:hypothetical protein